MSIESSSGIPYPHVQQEEIEQTEQVVRGVLGEMMAMGAIDSEPSDIEFLILKLRKREILPQDAVKQAYAIRDSKQAYH